LTDFEPQWGWIAPVIALSVTMAGLAWNQRNSLRSRLQGSDYGELLRLADRTETEVRMPFSIVLYVSLVSAFWSTFTAMVIEAVNNQAVEALLLGITAWLAAWTGLGMWSLAIHSGRHDRTMAEIEAMREELEASQRRYEAERQRTSPNADVSEVDEEIR
jgi:type IV secretory pathway TrbD component